ncbi:MAG TPA: STAS domain-containing protein [Thermodesulfobacteriota bacterium]|nr:STAS domain-containing protein [Thermodesulfobacteriota bacterium]
MEILKRKEKDALVISIRGRLDAVTTPLLDKDLTELMAGGEKFVVLNLRDLDYISSAGLRTILAATKKLREKQGRLHLASLKSVVREVFDISGFSSIIPVFETVDGAVSSR